MRIGPAVLVWFAVVVAVALAVLAAWIANQFGARTNLWTTGLTALIVSIFLAMLVFRPKTEEGETEEAPQDSGFKVLGGQVKQKVDEKERK